MTQVLAAIRPDDWNFPLLLHVFGALTLVGALTTAVALQFVAWRTDRLELGRLAFRTLLFIAFPAWWVMRIGAEWIYSKENLDALPEDPDWLGIGYITADLGGILLLISIILAWLNVRSLRKSEGTGGGGLGKAATVIATLVLLAYIVAVWAMAGKPD
jgi:hypothetical protein